MTTASQGNGEGAKARDWFIFALITALTYLTHHDPGRGHSHTAEGVRQFQPKTAPWEESVKVSEL
jgi:hypothetical protein